MKRRQRKWTKGKLLKEPEEHPILALWDSPEALEVIGKRGEDGLHFNDMRYLLCKDFKQIKRHPEEWKVFSDEKLKKMRVYNDYTILQKDLTKLTDIGFLRKEARGYYVHVDKPVLRYIRDITMSGRNLIGSTEECDILATDAIELTKSLQVDSEELFKRILEARAQSFKPKIMSFWKEVNSSKLDIQQKILLRGELYPFTSSEILKRLIKKRCLITTKKGKEAYDISPFRKRNAEKLRRLINITKKHSEHLGDYAVKYAMGMYSYPHIFTEKYIAKKGTDFMDEIQPYMQKLKKILSDFGKPCYVLLAPKR